MKWSILILLFALVIFIGDCTTPVAGNSSETNNGVMVVAGAGNITGKTPPYTILYLIGERYQPFEAITFDSVLTDSAGEFNFKAHGGKYNLFVYGNTGLRSLIKISLHDTSILRDTIYDTLSLPGSLDGYVPKAQSSNSWVFLEGSTFLTSVDRDGYFRLDSIPQGTYILKLFSSTNKNISPEIKDTLCFELTSVAKIRSDSLVTLRW